MHDDLRWLVRERFPGVQGTLERLVRIPSVSAGGADAPALRECAEATAAALTAAGLGAVRLLALDGAPAAVFGELPAPPGAPTVLLYAHYDVQPAGDPALWSAPPFEPVVRDGRLYGRGASDDKAGIAIHLAALDALRGAVPVGVKVLVEGEEELGSPHLAAFLARHGERLAADVIVVADSQHWRAGQPALTTSLRGLVDCDVEVRTLRDGVHSGMFGGPVPDALSALIRLLATLHDERGRVAVAGLVASEAADLDLTEAELRQQAGVLDGVALIGEGGLTARLWTQPAISVLAIDAPRVADSINQLVASARARVSLRLAPGEDAARAAAALTAHLRSHTPWGARVTVMPGTASAPFRLTPGGPGYRAYVEAATAAWGRPPLAIGIGGSIPMVAALADAYPRAEILLTGAGEPQSRIHGPDESQDLSELERGAEAEAITLRLLGAAR